MSFASRVARRYTHKVSCGAECNCGCGKTSPVEIYSEMGALPVEVELQRVGGELHPDGENYMSVQALESMRDHAEELLQKINSGTPLPDWVESKLARASQSLLDVYEYMAHGHGKQARQQKLLSEQFHVQYPNYRTIRLLVYPPGLSTFFEVRADERAAFNLLNELQSAGLTADLQDLQEAIEMA